VPSSVSVRIIPSHKHALLFGRWKWFLRMYFVHFVFYTSLPSDAGFLLARMVNQRLVSEKNATTH
jgi:hypothetical protein